MPILYPEGCINAGSLYSLAGALNTLHGWHIRHKGKNGTEPCLRLIIAEGESKITAIVTYQNETWNLVYREGEWLYIGDNAIC